MAKKALIRVPGFGRIVTERDALRAELEAARAASAREFVPPGHFYSAIPSMEDVRRNHARLFESRARTLPAIRLREAEQLELLRTFIPYYRELPFPRTRTPERRYWFENPSFSYADGIMLYSMIRHARPKRVVEIGSGYSSCVTLDTNELFFGGSIECTFIEPYPELLRSLMRAGDDGRTRIIAEGLQSVDLAVFAGLEANDILFVDSTHVSKIGSDVNQLFFEVLPRLAPGVYVHLHDIFHPFDYPAGWVYEGRVWSEAYLLRCFLEFNDGWDVVLFNDFIEQFQEPFFREHLPLCLENRGGSFWMRRRT